MALHFQDQAGADNIAVACRLCSYCMSGAVSTHIAGQVLNPLWSPAVSDRYPHIYQKHRTQLDGCSVPKPCWMLQVFAIPHWWGRPSRGCSFSWLLWYHHIWHPGLVEPHPEKNGSITAMLLSCPHGVPPSCFLGSQYLHHRASPPQRRSL